MSRNSSRGARAFAFRKVGSVHLSPTDLENSAAGALKGAPDGTTLVTHNTGSGIEHMLVTADRSNVESIAFAVSHIVSSNFTEVDEVPDLLQVGAFAKLEAIAGQPPVQATQSGADLTNLSKIIGGLLMPNEWVAVSVRDSTRAEKNRYRKWLEHYSFLTHHARSTNAVIMSLYAGGVDDSHAQEIVARVAAGIPGLGLEVRPRKISYASTAWKWAGAGVVALASCVGSFLLPDSMVVPVEFQATAGIAGVLGIAGAVLTARGFLPSEKRSLLRELEWGQVPAGKHRSAPPRKPHREKTKYGKDGAQRVVPEFGGDYPLDRHSFLTGPHIPISVVAPHSETSGGMSVSQRQAPPVVRESIGPKLGVNNGEIVRLSAPEAYQGVGVLGQAGSGKTRLLEQLWGSFLDARTNGSVWPGKPERHAMVAFDTKGDGLASGQYQAWAEAVGDKRTMRFDVFEPTQDRGIDLFPSLPGETADTWGRKVVGALRYIWGETSIGAESFDTLTRVFAAAKCVTPQIAARVTETPLPQNASPFYYADILLTNKGDSLAVELAAALKEAAANPATTTPDLVSVASLLSPLFGDGKTPSARAQLVKAPRTKVAALTSAEQWWARPQRTSWAQLLEADIATIVNTGASVSGIVPDDKLRVDMSGILVYTLAEEIKRTCIGWFENNRAVSIFSDELKHLANTSPDVINWMRHDARSNGVRCFFATQTPETLVKEVRATMLGFGSLVLFSQNDATTVRELVSDLQMAGGEWQSSDLVNLDKFNAIVRMTADGKRLEPFNIQIPNFMEERETGTWTA